MAIPRRSRPRFLDGQTFKELLERTNAVLHQGNQRKTTAKWRFVDGLHPISEVPEVEDKKISDGITFLPGNIKGLLDRFRLLFAEFPAGNTAATKNEIVGILDELLKRNYYNQREYNAMCKLMQCYS